MSQSGRLFEAPGPTPEILTLTGDTGGAVSPILGNIDIIGGPDVQVAGNPALATLTVNVSGRFIYTVTTLGNVATTLIDYPLIINEAVTITGNLVVAYNDFSHAGSGNFTIGAYRAAGGAVLIAGPFLDFSNDFGGVINASVSGNDLLLTVTGVAATTINWQAIAQVNTIS